MAIPTSRLDVMATAILGMEVLGQLPGILSPGLRRAILTSRSDVRADPFYHGERIASFHVRYECWPFCRVGQM